MRHNPASWSRTLSIFLTSVILAAGVRSAPAAAASATAFPDLSGHWAAGPLADAVAAGHVTGYPDGTFRPDAQVSRAEFIKLLVTAGGISMSSSNSSSIFNDMAGHWAAGFLNAADDYGIVIGSDYFGAFEPERPITRREAAVQTVRLLGQQYAAAQLKGDITLTDAPAMPLWERQYVQAAMQEAILTGYPDNTFRDQQPISRAEAVIVAERAAAAMKVGEEPSIKLIVNGKPVPSRIPPAIRSGYLYAPADAIYGALGHTTMFYRGSRLHLFPANDGFRYSGSRAEFPLGASYANLRTDDSQGGEIPMQQAPLLTTTYLDEGRLMIPVAAPDGNGSLPYATSRYDSGAATVTITTTADWPGNRLPQPPAQLKLFHVAQPLELHPGMAAHVPLPDPADADGNRISPIDTDQLTIQVAVDPASPVRLRANPDGPLLTSLDLPRYATNAARLVVDQSQEPVPEGAWTLTYAATGYTGVSLPVTVSDRRPAKLGLTVTGGSVGETQSIMVQLLDSRGRRVDQSYRSDYENAGPTVTVTLPDGSTAEAAPVIRTDISMGRPFILVHGLGRFTFTPPAPGAYHYAARFHPPISGGHGDFEAAADVTCPVIGVCPTGEPSACAVLPWRAARPR